MIEFEGLLIVRGPVGGEVFVGREDDPEFAVRVVAELQRSAELDFGDDARLAGSARLGLELAEANAAGNPVYRVELVFDRHYSRSTSASAASSK